MSKIRILYINIYLSRWGVSNEKGIFESCRKQLHTGLYETEISIESLERKLYHVILSHQGDGLDLNMQTTKQGTYVDVELIVNDGDDAPNIDYLLNFLKPFQSKRKIQGQKYSLSEFEGYIYIQCFSSEDLDSLLKSLKEQKIDMEVVSESRKSFEKGAGSYFIAYVIGIASSASWTVAKKVLEKVRNKRNIYFSKTQMESIDVGLLKEKVSEYTGINQQDLVLVSFEEIEKENRKYKIWFRNRYKTISITSNAQGYISDFKIYDKSQTHI